MASTLHAWGIRHLYIEVWCVCVSVSVCVCPCKTKMNANILVCCYIAHWFTSGPLGHVGVTRELQLGLCWAIYTGWFMLGSCWHKNWEFGSQLKWAYSSGVMLGPCWGYWGHVGAMLGLCGISCWVYMKLYWSKLGSCWSKMGAPWSFHLRASRSPQYLPAPRC